MAMRSGRSSRESRQSDRKQPLYTRSSGEKGSFHHRSTGKPAEDNNTVFHLAKELTKMLPVNQAMDQRKVRTQHESLNVVRDLSGVLVDAYTEDSPGRFIDIVNDFIKSGKYLSTWESGQINRKLSGALDWKYKISLHILTSLESVSQDSNIFYIFMEKLGEECTKICQSLEDNDELPVTHQTLITSGDLQSIKAILLLMGNNFKCDEKNSDSSSLYLPIPHSESYSCLTFSGSSRNDAELTLAYLNKLVNQLLDKDIEGAKATISQLSTNPIQCLKETAASVSQVSRSAAYDNFVRNFKQSSSLFVLNDLMGALDEIKIESPESMESSGDISAND